MELNLKSELERKHKMKQKIYFAIVIVLAIIVIACSVMSLVLRDATIPGVAPFSCGLLMITMMLNTGVLGGKKWVKILFLVAALLNFMAAILQIVTAVK